MKTIAILRTLLGKREPLLNWLRGQKGRWDPELEVVDYLCQLLKDDPEGRRLLFAVLPEMDAKRAELVCELLPGEVSDWSPPLEERIVEWREPVRVASSCHVDLGRAIRELDGVQLEVHDRVLLKDQEIQRENGVYVHNGIGLVRAPDGNEDGSLTEGVGFYVMEGGVGSGTIWVCILPTYFLVGLTDLTFCNFGGEEVPPRATQTKYTVTGAHVSPHSFSAGGFTATSETRLNGMRAGNYHLGSRDEDVIPEGYDEVVYGTERLSTSAATEIQEVVYNFEGGA